MNYFALKEDNGVFSHDPATLLATAEQMKALTPQRFVILKYLTTPRFTSEIMAALSINEQQTYYHLTQLEKAGLIQVVSTKEVRGATAKQYGVTHPNLLIRLHETWNDFSSLQREKTQLDTFLEPFIHEGKLNAKIVVGSPDPHGSFKARARDGHYAIDLALFLGQHCRSAEGLCVSLDVDIKLSQEKNCILVGGPVTNLCMQEANSKLGLFSQDPWALVGRETYHDEHCGMIARIPNPYFKDGWLLIIAGVRFSGTKAAVLGLTQHATTVLARFKEQRNFISIVEGFDLDGDGKIDSAEVRE